MARVASGLQALSDASDGHRRPTRAGRRRNLAFVEDARDLASWLAIEFGEDRAQLLGVLAPSPRRGKPIHWPQDVMRHAAMALRECGSSDIFTAARAVLEATIRSANDLIELLRPDTAAMSALPPRTDVVSAAGYGR
jgi:hypothetical protein